MITIGNHHVFMGPDDLNGYGYFHARLYWTEVCFHDAVERSVPHLCWSEANVEPEAVYRIDGLSIEIGPYLLSL